MPHAVDSHLTQLPPRLPPSPLPLKHDANRAPRFWHVAVNVTKGLFNQPSRPALDGHIPASAPSVPRVEDRRRRVRRSISTPALKACASTGNLRCRAADFSSPPPPSLFISRSNEHSPRKSKFKTPTGQSAARRPAISSPSLPKPLDSIDCPHPKLAYPLSPMPSPVGSTFSVNAQSVHSSSKQPVHLLPSDDVVSVNSDAYNDSRVVRRRTKSAPGAKLSNLSLFSPALSPALESDTASSEPSSPIVIDIASPSIASPASGASLPSPPLETPTMSTDYFCNLSSPLVQVVSPRSFTSVKRKPVPRHLYTEPPAHDASAPCTPVLTPVPSSPPNVNGSTSAAKPGGLGSLHTPLLPSSELILKSCNPSRINNRGLNLLPIGQPRDSVRRQHRRSVSEQGHSRLLGPDAGLGLPSLWYTTNASGSMTPLITPAEEQAPFSFSNDLPAAPRVLPQSPPQTPTNVTEEISAFSDNTSVRSSVSRSGALSPLTDEEIDAIRNFLRRHATGHRARQRRKASMNAHSRKTSISSISYDMHAQILESYATDEDEFFSLDESDDDADAESHMPMSASETYSTSAMSVTGLHDSENGDEDEDDDDVVELDVDTPVIRDEIETPVDAVNRGTFGYYGTPVVRKARSFLGSNDVYIQSDSELDSRPSLPAEWRKGGKFGVMSQSNDLTGKTDGDANVQAEDVDCAGTMDFPNATSITGPPRSSSLYYRSSSDYTAQSDDDDRLDEERISRQPLVPRMLSLDLESERPLSSSTSFSLSASTSASRSAFASGIGLAIIPPEHFAHFDRMQYEYVPPCSPSGCDDVDSSPRTLPRSSPTLLDRRACDHKCSNPFDNMKSNLSNLQMQLPRTDLKDAEPRCNANDSSPVLKPALQIHAGRSIASIAPKQLPSPTDTIETYPSQTHALMKGCAGQKAAGSPKGVHWTIVGSASADEANPDNVKSFMNLTPNDPTPKRSRVRLRNLFSRANLRGGNGTKSLCGVEGLI